MAFIWQIQGKAILARDFAEKVNEYLCENLEEEELYQVSLTNHADKLRDDLQ